MQDRRITRVYGRGVYEFWSDCISLRGKKWDLLYLNKGVVEMGLHQFSRIYSSCPRVDIPSFVLLLSYGNPFLREDS